MTPSVHILRNKNRTESYEQDSLNMSLNVSSFQKFFLSRVGAGAGAGAGAAGSGASPKFLPGAGAGAA
jgi:hypothetical protein